MASGAIQGRVHSRQREAGELQMIELRSQPCIDRVTLLALRREAAGNVVRRCRLLKRVLVTGIALNR